MAALVPARAASTLDDELESERDEVWLVETRAFAVPNAASTLDDELEIEFELTLIAVSAASRLDDEFERLREEA